MKSNKTKLKASLRSHKPESFDAKFWAKFESQNKKNKFNWYLPVGFVLSCFLLIVINFNSSFNSPELTFSDFDSYVNMQFELEFEDDLVAEVVIDDDILFE